MILSDTALCLTCHSSVIVFKPSPVVSCVFAERVSSSQFLQTTIKILFLIGEQISRQHISDSTLSICSSFACR
jgi:hypothetical protein